MTATDTAALRRLDVAEAKRLQALRMDRSDLEKKAARAGALADPTRLDLADILSAASAPLCVGDLAYVLDRPLNVTSHHLQSLRRTDLVQATRDGRLSLYSLTAKGRELLDAVAGVTSPT